MGQFLPVQLLSGIEPLHQFLLRLFRHDECLWGIRNRDGGHAPAGRNPAPHVEPDDGSLLDAPQQGKDML
ncbi:hypothetical protein [Bacteroides uniformis]|uniref:hypothetical protein n=1 Tax=Bacteroides uniformis TaxID=820 RepID=UPI001E28A8D7|nr:hypothetical protein [Bacteroides uniformis]MDC1998206.1 hypothetical protein [Bacteroides uniformis]MDC2001970.1 hypothetical protein [Bacteroides uniformis]MDC2005707.1 hypothetical protein [Bacteroides uniformis]